MVSRIRNKLGPAGLIVAIVALVAALSGAALAASGLNSVQKKEVKKIAKQFAGKPGEQGPTGPQGAPGASGKDGVAGKDGAAGTAGAVGKSVKVGTEAAGANCETGGVNVEVEGSNVKRYVCDGKDGGVSEVMAPGTTLRGAWSIGSTSPDVSVSTTSVSFVTQYPAGGTPTMVYVKTAGENADKCPGSAEEPDAEPGFLCFYEKIVSPEGPGEVTVNPISGFNTSRSGATLALSGKQEGATFAQVLALGSWAVTAPVAP